VQIAKALGAEVTGVSSPEKLDLVRSIGADHVVDYTSEDFTRDRYRYDVIVDNAGNHSLSSCRRALRPDGTLVLVGKSKWPLTRVMQALVLSRFVGQSLVPFIANVGKEDLLFLTGLAEAGKLTPVVGRTYPLSGVPDAIRYVEEGHARGKVVITVSSGP